MLSAKYNVFTNLMEITDKCGVFPFVPSSLSRALLVNVSIILITKETKLTFTQIPSTK